MFLPKMFLHIFHTRCSNYRRVLVKCCTKKFYVHTDFEKLEGTLVGGCPRWRTCQSGPWLAWQIDAQSPLLTCSFLATCDAVKGGSWRWWADDARSAADVDDALEPLTNFWYCWQNDPECWSSPSQFPSNARITHQITTSSQISKSDNWKGSYINAWKVRLVELNETTSTEEEDIFV